MAARASTRAVSLSSSITTRTCSGLAALPPVVLLGSADKARRITLNRTKVLNSLDVAMVRAITPAYREWNQDPRVAVVLIKGAGPKAFCAGGDIVAVREAGLRGESVVEVVQFFKEEYILNHLIATAPKPQVALLNGITMGGGVGLSVPGRFRVATDHTLFAMPETGIGFFPDVGGSWFLPRLPGHLGMFLALTGARLKGKDVFEAGIATHFVPAARMEELEVALCAVTESKAVEGILDSFSEQREGKTSYAPHLDRINSIFALGSVQSMVEALEALAGDGSDWATGVLKTLHRASPFSLMVTFDQMQRGRACASIAECLQMEYRMTVRFMKDGEFYEGVRNLLVDKEKTRAHWKHSTLAEVPASRVAAVFAPLDPDSEGPELELAGH